MRLALCRHFVEEPPASGIPQATASNVDLLGQGFGDDVEADCPKVLADQCLRELMGKV